MSLPINGINSDAIKQEFLEAASHRDADKLEEMLAEHGDDLVQTYGKVQHRFDNFIESRNLESEGNALHQVGVGRIYPEAGNDPFSLDLLFNRALRDQRANTEGKKLTRCVKLLVNHGCDVNRACSRGWTPLHQVISDIRGEIPLSHVNDCVDTLLQRGANPLVLTQDGQSPLDVCRSEDLKKTLELRFDLVVPRYKEQIQEIGANKKKIAELRQAIVLDDLEEVDRVLAKGVDLTDHSKDSPLAMAVMLDRQAILKKLVESGADLHQIFEFEKDDHLVGSNLLSMAWILEKADIFKYLVKQGLDPNEKTAESDEVSASPSERLWHSLALYGDVTYMRVILETLPESLDFQTPSGRSILEYLKPNRSDELKEECEEYAKAYVDRLDSKQEEMKAFQNQLKIFDALEALENTPSLEEARNVYFKKMAEAADSGIDETTIKVCLKEREFLGPFMKLAKQAQEKGSRWLGLWRDGPMPQHDLIRSWLEAYASKDTSSSWREELKAMLQTSKDNSAEQQRAVRRIFPSKSTFANAVEKTLKAGDYDALHELLQSHPMFSKLIAQFPLVTTAASLGHWEMVKKLVEGGASPNEKSDLDEMISPLHMALQAGCEEVVDVLIKHGADQTAIDGQGLNMMYYATLSGNKALCERVSGWTT